MSNENKAQLLRNFKYPLLINLTLAILDLVMTIGGEPLPMIAYPIINFSFAGIIVLVYYILLPLDKFITNWIEELENK